MNKPNYIRRVYVPVATLDGNFLSNDLITVYAIINMIIAGRELIDYCYVSLEEIGREIYDKVNIDTKQRKKIKDAMLKINDIIPETIILTERNDVFKINIYNIMDTDFEKFKYGYCYVCDLRKIMRIQQTNIFIDVGFYFKILSTFDYEYNVGHISIQKIAEILRVKEQTVKNHLKRYKDSKALHTIKRCAEKISDDKFYKYPNVYYRTYDEELAVKCLKNLKPYFDTIKKHSPSPKD